MLVDRSEVDPDDNYYRIRVGNQVKYLIIESGVFHVDVLTFPPDLLSKLPPLPPGNWVQALVARGHDGNPDMRLVHISLIQVRTQFQWHPNRVDVLSLEVVNTLKRSVQVVRYDGRLVVAKISQFEFEIARMENETVTYRLINGHGIGLAFLGHIVEGGRVVGFLIELVHGRAAGLEDMLGCRDVAQRLHALDIVHEDLNRYNFVVASDGTVTLIDFENASLCSSVERKDQELATLPSELTEESYRGRGRGTIMSLDE
jgi:predicted Ser/Thr protein kinase